MIHFTPGLGAPRRDRKRRIRAPLLDVRERRRVPSPQPETPEPQPTITRPQPRKSWLRPIHVRGSIQLAELILLPLRAVRHVVRNRRILTLGKLWNVVKVEIGAVLQLRQASGLPTIVKIETTNACNTFCQLCPTGNQLLSRAKGLMDPDEFSRIVDQVKKHAYVIDLTQWGDPLIHPDIYDMIRYVHDSRVYSYISSNFHGFQKEDAGRLVASGLDELTVSLHGITQESYEAYQPGRSLSEVVDKIRAVVEAKRRAAAHRPKVQINFAVTAKNEHEIAWVPAFARALGVGYKIETGSMNLRFLHRNKHLDTLDLTDRERGLRMKSHLEEWLPKRPDSQKWVLPAYRAILEDGDLVGGTAHAQGLDPLSSDQKMVRCDWPWRKTVIHWDGAVVPCCGVYDKKWTFDNVGEKPLKEIFNGPAYLASRETFHGENTPNGKGPETPCSGCPGWML